MKTIYMDHAATTAMSKTALEEMLPYFAEEYGNPSAVYSYGQTGKNAIEKCRERIARCIGAFKTEIYFTSGGTESDNWAIRSACRLRKNKGKHIISTEIEHNAVRKTLEQLMEDGYEVTFLKPDQTGQITAEQLEAAIRDDTVLISIMMANNVVGTILDIQSLEAVARKHRILFHTDAVQAVGHIPIEVHKLGVDFLSVSDRGRTGKRRAFRNRKCSRHCRDDQGSRGADRKDAVQYGISVCTFQKNGRKSPEYPGRIKDW